MTRALLLVAVLIVSVLSVGSEEKKSSYVHFDYEVARAHEIKPHRRTVPVDGVEQGFNQLHLTLTVSPVGDVLDTKAEGDPRLLELWPELVGEVRQWKFTPFEKDGKAIPAEVAEYLDLVPPERLPKTHVTAPMLRDDSKVAITLRRSGCYGSCPSYRVSVSTDGIVFEGGRYVAAAGAHRDTVEASKVRELARRFIKADFYSMDSDYQASVTDCPTYVLTIAIDGRTKEVVDYMGSWIGMPAVITELEDEVDEFAQTERWIKGVDGLVEALQAEKFNFKSYEAQVILKEAARRGQAVTVEGLLEAGVPLKPFPAPKGKENQMGTPFEDVGWLNAAGDSPDVLQVLIDAGASRNNQNDKDLALIPAARSGKVEAVRALIAYGANPNADLRKLTVTEESGAFSTTGRGSGSILIYAAQSGNPEMVKEILSHHPNLEARGYEGKTAMFAAGDYRSTDVDGSRVECVRLLAEAGADVNARDQDGNTPLHETFLTDVEEELLKLGADVNARNNDGETPIFTTVQLAEK